MPPLDAPSDELGQKVCPNCGTPVTGRYCASCGQRHSDVRVSLRRILMDVLEDQFSLNSTLPRTFSALFLHPGRLTREYMGLRIARYIPPFRLYLVTSIVFFLVLSFRGNIDQIVVDQTSPMADSARAAVDSAAARRRAARDTIAHGDTTVRDGLRVQTSREVRGVTFQVDSVVEGKNWAENMELNLPNKRLEEAVRARVLELGEQPPEEAFRLLSRTFVAQVPKVMFLLLPVYALLLKLLYIRRKRYYVEHFIFALHTHAFMFLIFTLMLLLNHVPFAVLALGFWMPVYIWIALKRVYTQGWIRTTLKWAVLGYVYLMILVVAFVLTFIAGVFLV